MASSTARPDSIERELLHLVHVVVPRLVANYQYGYSLAYDGPGRAGHERRSSQAADPTGNRLACNCDYPNEPHRCARELLKDAAGQITAGVGQLSGAASTLSRIFGGIPREPLEDPEMPEQKDGLSAPILELRVGGMAELEELERRQLERRQRRRRASAKDAAWNRRVYGDVPN